MKMHEENINSPVSGCFSGKLIGILTCRSRSWIYKSKYSYFCLSCGISVLRAFNGGRGGEVIRVFFSFWYSFEYHSLKCFFYSFSMILTCTGLQKQEKLPFPWGTGWHPKILKGTYVLNHMHLVEMLIFVVAFLVVNHLNQCFLTAMDCHCSGWVMKFFHWQQMLA